MSRAVATFALLVVACVVQASLDADEHPAYAMHEAWCVSGGGHDQHAPCMKHRAMQKLGDDVDEAQIAKIDEIMESELAEAQNRDMNEWWCGRPESINSAVGSPLRDYCEGWEEHKRNAVQYAMHEAWCALAGHEQTAPCIKHRAVLELGPEDDGDDQLEMSLEQIDQQVGPELADAQNTQMHEYWCGRKEAMSAPAGSAVREYCDGWAEYKHEKEGFKGEL